MIGMYMYVYIYIYIYIYIIWCIYCIVCIYIYIYIIAYACRVHGCHPRQSPLSQNGSSEPTLAAVSCPPRLPAERVFRSHTLNTKPETRNHPPHPSERSAVQTDKLAFVCSTRAVPFEESPPPSPFDADCVTLEACSRLADKLLLRGCTVLYYDYNYKNDIHILMIMSLGSLHLLGAAPQVFSCAPLGKPHPSWKIALGGVFSRRRRFKSRRRLRERATVREEPAPPKPGWADL